MNQETPEETTDDSIGGTLAQETAESGASNEINPSAEVITALDKKIDEMLASISNLEPVEKVSKDETVDEVSLDDEMESLFG